MSLVVPGLFFTVALPAYAIQNTGDDAAEANAELQAFKDDGAQTVIVSENVVAAAVTREKFTATSAAADASCGARRRIPLVTRPVGRPLLANPPYPNFDLNQVVAVAKKYQGVSVPLGRRRPVGLRLLGLHAVRVRAVRHRAAALVVAPEFRRHADRRVCRPPGDLVFMDGGGHVGIYLGGNSMIDAPYAWPGRADPLDLQPEPLVRALRHLAVGQQPRSGVSRHTTCRYTAVSGSRATLKTSNVEIFRRESMPRSCSILTMDARTAFRIGRSIRPVVPCRVPVM